jgi:dienelactone hydrolase
MSQLIEKALDYHFGSTRMSGHFVVDELQVGPRPGVLVVHDGFGLGSHAIGAAQRLAQLGYAALAVDLWGERARFGEIAPMMETIGRFKNDPTLWMGHVDAARDAFVTQTDVDGANLAGIGYCFGGATVLEYARSGADVRGVVSFHAGLDVVGSDWGITRTKAKVLLCTGADDPMAPPSALVALQHALGKGGVDWEVNTYGGTKHGFTNPEVDKAGMPHALAYNKRADLRSWGSMVTFLAGIFGEA